MSLHDEIGKELLKGLKYDPLGGEVILTSVNEAVNKVLDAAVEEINKQAISWTAKSESFEALYIDKKSTIEAIQALKLDERENQQ